MGTVLDTGPTISALIAEFRRKVNAQDWKLLEKQGELSFSDTKRIWAQVLPREARPHLRRVQNEEQLQKLTAQYFPVLAQWERPVRFAVDETFKGEHSLVRTVWTGQGSGDCGLDFQLGERYVVFAFPDEKLGREMTGICSRTRPVADAADDLAYLRSAIAGIAKPRVFGIVTSDLCELRTRILRSANEPAKFPVSGVRLKVESENIHRESVTDSTGRFEFSDLPPGIYRMTAVQAGFRFHGLPQLFGLEPAGCFTTTILALDPVSK